MIELMQGDCLELLPTLADRSVDAVICDPPYGTTACKWDSVIPFAPMWEQLKRIIKPRGAIVLFGSQPFTSALVMSNPGMFKYELVWDKNYGIAPGVAKYRPMPSHEVMLVFADGKTTYNPQFSIGKPYVINRTSGKRTHANDHGYGLINTFSVTNNGYRYPLSVVKLQHHNTPGKHPTQKPVALLSYLVKTYTNEGDTVLDFTMGSGTTGVACVETGRKFIGIEKDAGYFDVASKRIEAAVASLRQLEVFA